MNIELVDVSGLTSMAGFEVGGRCKLNNSF